MRKKPPRIAALAGLLLASLLRAATAAATSDEALARLFSEAGDDCLGGRYEAAAHRYHEILDRGFVSPELYYNLGTVYLAGGDPGRAVLSFRRAWHLGSRDAGLARNLGVALQRCGARAPSEGPLLAASHLLRASEWAGLALAAYWIGLGTLVLRRWRQSIAPVMPAAALILSLALAGFAYARFSESRHEAVVITGPQDVRLAPTPNARSTTSLPEGSVVRIVYRGGEWVRVTCGEQNGWIPAASVEPVTP